VNILEKKVLSFDCYGTLIDWETGLVKALRNFGEEKLTSKSDDELLSLFAHTEHVIEEENAHLKYQEILDLVAKRIFENLGLIPSELQLISFSRSVLDWLPFDDTVKALARLSQKFKLVILSNIDNESIAESAKKLGNPFFNILTAEDIGAYKPSHKVFEYLFTTLDKEGIGKNEILHVAQSLYHDHVPASQLGLDSVWINRRYDKEGQGASKEVDKKYVPELQFKSLEEFAEYALKVD
jgi:2-haloalkanoic acid dehalogenase type II